MCKRKFQEPGDVPLAIDYLFKSSGIETADKLSIDHLKQSLINLEDVSYHDPST